jgi:hypothetical protein
VNATGAKSAEGNQELFLFHKSLDGAWKIARYSFSSTNRCHNSSKWHVNLKAGLW